MWPGSLSFPFFLLYSCLQSITRFRTPLSPVPGWPAAVQFGTAGVSQPAGANTWRDPGREQRIVAGGTGKCCPRVSYASHKEMLEVELLV